MRRPVYLNKLTKRLSQIYKKSEQRGLPTKAELIELNRGLMTQLRFNQDQIEIEY